MLDTMMDSELKNRVLVEAIKVACREQGITCTFLSDDWVIRLKKGNVSHFVYGYGLDVNSQASANIAIDKVATYELLKEAQIDAVPHYLLSSPSQPEISSSSLDELLIKHKSLVIKPNLGSRGEMVARVDSVNKAIEFTKDTGVVSWAVSPYLDIKNELRLVVLNGAVMLAYEKINPQFINNLAMFNLSLGAGSKELKLADISYDLKSVAVKAMEAIGLKFGAVDIVLDEQKSACVLEVNSGFSLEHYAKSSVTAKAQVIELYKKAVETLF